MTYKELRSRHYVRWATISTKVWASFEVMVLHLIAIVAWLACGPYFEFSNGWQFLMAQAISIETVLLSLMILVAVLRAGDVTDAKLDVIQRDLPDVDSSLIGLHNRPDDEVPVIEPLPNRTVPRDYSKI